MQWYNEKPLERIRKVIRETKIMRASDLYEGNRISKTMLII